MCFVVYGFCVCVLLFFFGLGFLVLVRVTGKQKHCHDVHGICSLSATEQSGLLAGSSERPHPCDLPQGDSWETLGKSHWPYSKEDPLLIFKVAGYVGIFESPLVV